jgi:hypothetical protein
VVVPKSASTEDLARLESLFIACGLEVFFRLLACCMQEVVQSF